MSNYQITSMLEKRQIIWEEEHQLAVVSLGKFKRFWKWTARATPICISYSHAMWFVLWAFRCICGKDRYAVRFTLESWSDTRGSVKKSHLLPQLYLGDNCVIESINIYYRKIYKWNLDSWILSRSVHACVQWFHLQHLYTLVSTLIDWKIKIKTKAAK